jgi:hypothetical protein
MSPIHDVSRGELHPVWLDNQLDSNPEFVTQFEIYRAEIAQARMTSLSIVPVVDPRRDLALRFAPRVPVSIVDEFALEGGEKALDHGVVPAVPFLLMLQTIP